MLYKSLPKSKPNRFPRQCAPVLHNSTRITRCFDFLPFCLSTQLMASLPVWVIRAECINLVFIYTPWIQHGLTKLEIPLLFFWQRTLSLLALYFFVLNLKTSMWPLFSGPWGLLLEVTPASACGLRISQPSIHASGCHVHCLKATRLQLPIKIWTGFDSEWLQLKCVNLLTLQRVDIHC